MGTASADDPLHGATEISRGQKCKTKTIKCLKENKRGTSLVVPWLRCSAPTAGGAGLILGLGTKILHAAQPKNRRKKKNNKRKSL